MAPRVVCVVGPTACGKTALGVLLAKRYNGEVVSADSMQMYRGMTIGTAAPTAEAICTGFTLCAGSAAGRDSLTASSTGAMPVCTSGCAA